MRILTVGILSLALAFLPVGGVAQNSAKPSPATGTAMSPKVSVSDQKFVREAAQGNLAEVELGKLATEKATGEEVKKFAQRMVDDHTKAGDEVKNLANQKGVTVPEQLTPKDKATRDRLAKMSGAQFDKAYVSDMVKDHTQDVAEFERESQLANDSDIKDFAARTLPTLQDHLRQAKDLAPAGRASGNGQ